MKFIHEILPNGDTKITCLGDNDEILEVRIFSKSTVDFLKQVDLSSEKHPYTYPKGIAIPVKNIKHK